ncbi:MAG: bifunctional phosphopantothenoylcysteine decarboxylase/phosphopantothenate--cysteine ligase CoaBC [Bacteroidota bacterium]
MELSGTKILFGVSGSISAYKSADIVRLFTKNGADVQVVMTSAAQDFITPLTLSTLSGKPVLTRFNDPESGWWNNHVELGLWADLMLIAPLSAHTAAKLASGFCEDLLAATYLSARCPVFVAPAMDHDMYQHAATQSNLNKLKEAGCQIIGPEYGELASGLIGQGRLTEPIDIYNHIVIYLKYKNSLKGKRALVSAGPTREAIDAVRYVSNSSTGKMGVAIANELHARGCLVDLVCGPGVSEPVNHGIAVHNVITASQMHSTCMELFQKTDISIMAAAVADYAPCNPASNKIKKESGSEALTNVEFKPTVDILADMGIQKKSGQFLVGFALESDNEESNAKQKLQKKNLDLIILNSLRYAGSGFGTDTNKVTMFSKSGEILPLPLQSKKSVAGELVSFITSKMTK